MEKNAELIEKIAMAADLIREVTKETGCEILLRTAQNDCYDTAASRTYIGTHYRHDHFYDGREVLSYKMCEIKPEAVRWTEIPEGYLPQVKK